MTAPLVLGFDTAGPYCAAALVRGDVVLDVRVEDMARGQAERLIGLLNDCLAARNLQWSDLDALGVGIGPGNFTGIRISISAARGLGLGLGIPVVGVSLFETTQRLSQWTQTGVPAPRGQVYYLDPDTAVTPVLLDRAPTSAFALSSAHSTEDHVRTIAALAGKRAAASVPPPKPLYVKPPDAAPARDAPPRVLS